MKLADPGADYESALAFLLGRINYERLPSVPYMPEEFKLDRMRELLVRLGNPQQAFPIVHIAGTKGKGSTAAMIAAVLTAAGLRTGLYTSPHLERIEERVAIDGRICPAEDFARLVHQLRPIAEAMDATSGQASDPRPTYFELTTALALERFRQERVAAAVLEVGLGGRLDSTNVCTGVVSVITSISFDHMKQLGNTLALIAAEKAGIIKPGVPVVSGVVAAEPRDVIRRVASERGSPLFELGEHFWFDDRPARIAQGQPEPAQLDFQYADGRVEVRLSDLCLGLAGHHQAINAAVAIATIVQLRQQGWDIPDDAVRAGLLAARSPGRVEVIAERPVVVLDVAHNVASIEALVRTLRESFSARRRVLVFATTREKETAGMLQALVPAFDHLIFTRYLKNPRSVPPDELMRAAAALGATSSEVQLDPASAWEAAKRQAEADDLICLTGSFFLAGEMRPIVAAAPAGDRAG